MWKSLQLSERRKNPNRVPSAGGTPTFPIAYTQGKTMHLNPKYGTRASYKDAMPMLRKALARAESREEQLFILAQHRAHRRMDKYCTIVKVKEMPWEISKHTRAWRLVREATALVRSLRRYERVGD